MLSNTRHEMLEPSQAMTEEAFGKMSAQQIDCVAFNKEVENLRDQTQALIPLYEWPLTSLAAQEDAIDAAVKLRKKDRHSLVSSRASGDPCDLSTDGQLGRLWDNYQIRQEQRGYLEQLFDDLSLQQSAMDLGIESGQVLSIVTDDGEKLHVQKKDRVRAKTKDECPEGYLPDMMVNYLGTKTFSEWCYLPVELLPFPSPTVIQKNIRDIEYNYFDPDAIATRATQRLRNSPNQFERTAAGPPAIGAPTGGRKTKRRRRGKKKRRTKKLRRKRRKNRSRARISKRSVKRNTRKRR
jgi:hypothetical protein